MHSLAKLKIQDTVNFTFRNAINCSTVFLKKGIIYLSQLNRHSKKWCQNMYNTSIWVYGLRE